MITIQDVGLQLTKPVKELAEWHFPFSQTLERYCCLFKQLNNKSFGEAGLVLQNSTAVYVHRVDSLWAKMEHFRNVFSNHEHEEISKGSSSRKKDRNTNINFQDFTTINFDKEVEKNIDIKKNHISQILKSKSRRFTQLEKGITQNIPIDIYDVNGETIGKKYDFRCNQNINMDGVLIDEFAPQDFCRNGDTPAQERSCTPSTSSLSSRITESLAPSCNTSALESIDHSNEPTNSDAESERNCIDSIEKTSDLATSIGSNQDLSLSRNTDTDALPDMSLDNSIDNLNLHFTDATNETCISNLGNTNSPISDSIIDDHTSSNNNDSDAKSSNNNVRNNVEIDNQLSDSSQESVNSPKIRTPSVNKPILPNGNEERCQMDLSVNHVQRTPSKDSSGNKSRQRSAVKSTPKSNKRKGPVTPRKNGRIAKNLLNEFRSPRMKNFERILEQSNSLLQRRDKTNMLGVELDNCIRNIQQYDALRYNDVTNVALDFLGFQLGSPKRQVNTNSNADVDSNVDVNKASIEDEISEIYSPTCRDASPLHESFCDTWLRSDSPNFLPGNVDKWHELMQPKLHDAEQRSAFRIRDYTSRIIESLEASGKRKISFDAIIQKERPCEVARYFLASLDLASRQNVDISTDKDLDHNIEIVLREENRQHLSNGQLD